MAMGLMNNQYFKVTPITVKYWTRSQLKSHLNKIRDVINKNVTICMSDLLQHKNPLHTNSENGKIFSGLANFSP